MPLLRLDSTAETNRVGIINYWPQIDRSVQTRVFPNSLRSKIHQERARIRVTALDPQVKDNAVCLIVLVISSDGCFRVLSLIEE